MNKAELKMLERAFAAEINGALSRSGLHLLQTRSKLAEKLVNDGMLKRAEVQFGGRLSVLVTGYELTQAGHLMFCACCET